MCSIHNRHSDGGSPAKVPYSYPFERLETVCGHSVLDGVPVLVPCVSITFTEEKYDDIQGHREATDVPHAEGL